MLQQQQRNIQRDDQDRTTRDTADQANPTSVLIDHIPDNIDSPHCKLVYLYCAYRNGASIDELQHALQISKLSLLPSIAELERRDLVEPTADGYIAR